MRCTLEVVEQVRFYRTTLSVKRLYLAHIMPHLHFAIHPSCTDKDRTRLFSLPGRIGKIVKTHRNHLFLVSERLILCDFVAE